MAKKVGTAAEAVASMNPDEMVPGGLKDDFDGIILKARYAPWDYNGAIEEPVLSGAVTIKPDEDEDPFTQNYSAGSLSNFAPSNDGKTPAGSKEDGYEEGLYALRVGGRQQLNNNTNWAQFLGSLRDCDFKGFKPEASCIEGLYCHFNRVPQVKRSGIVQADDGGGQPRRQNDVLVVTEIKGVRGQGARPVGKAAAGAAKSGPAVAADDLDEVLQAAVLEALGDKPLRKSQLVAIALRAMTGDPRKAKAARRVTEAGFLGSGPWGYDPDAGTVAIEE